MNSQHFIAAQNYNIKEQGGGSDFDCPEAASVIESSACHLLGYFIMHLVHRPELALPSESLRVNRVALPALGDDVPHGVKLVMLSKQVLVTEIGRGQIPDSHEPIK